MLKKITKYLKAHHTWTLPLFLSVLFFIPILIWLSIDSHLPGQAEAHNLYNSLQYGRVWYNYLSGTESIVGLATWYTFLPPFFYQSAVIFYVLFGTGQSVAIASNIIWLFILLFSLYNLALHLWNQKTAVLSSLLLLTVPIFIDSLKDYQVYLPLTAWVALTYYLCYKYHPKFSYRSALALGIVLGLGMLISWQYLIFVLPILVAFLWKKLVGAGRDLKRILLLSVSSLAIGFIICGFWYISNRLRLHQDLSATFTHPYATSFINYFAAISRDYLLLPLLIAFVAGIVLIFYNKKFKSNLPILIWIIIVFVFYAFLPNFDDRNLLPLAPFMALIAASILNSPISKFSKSFIWAGAIGLFILNIIFQNFSGLNHSFGFGKYLPIIESSNYKLGSPKQAVCPINSIVSVIPPDSSARLVGVDTIDLNNWVLAYYLEKSGRIWAGNSEDTSQSDFWVVHLNSNPESRITLFNYQDRGLVVANFNCRDKSLVVVLKKGNYTFNPTY